MKAQNALVKFQNHTIHDHLIGDSAIVKLDTIVRQDVKGVLKDKFIKLLQMYSRNCFQNGYNSRVAYRVMVLYLMTEGSWQFDMVEQMNRLIQHTLKKGEFGQIQMSMDLLMLKQMKLKVSDRQLKIWKVQILCRLKIHYDLTHKKQQKWKVSRTIRTICLESLKRDDVRKDSSMQEMFIDILLNQETQRIQYCLKKGKNLQGIEYGNNIIRVIQNSNQSIMTKYQKNLMVGYWNLAQLHNKLHYISYAKKYAIVALNIAERLNQTQYIEKIKEIIEQLTI